MDIKYNYIPSNLSLDKLAKKLPTKYNLDKDKLGYIISTIIHAGFTCKTLTFDGYIPLYSPLLKKQMYNYNEAIDFLIQNGVVSKTKSYLAGKDGYSLRYRIEPKYSTKIEAIPITNNRFSHSLTRKANSLNKNGDKRLRTCDYLDKWLKSSDLIFDSKQAMLDLDLYKQSVVNSGGQISNHEIMRLSYAIARCSSQDLIMGRDNTSGRYHTVLTGLKSDFRKNFKFKGKQLVQIDIVNCQPYLSQVIFKQEFWKKGIMSLHHYKSYKISTIYSIMLQKSSETPVNTEIVEYINQVNSGTFYETFMELVIKTKSVNLTRKEAKVAMYQVLFSSNKFTGSRPNYPRYDATLKDLFVKTFPTVSDRFRSIKSKKKEALAILLQNLESYLIIDVCCKRISKENPDCPIFTIHDSISTIPEYVDYVKSIVLEEFEKFVGAKPPLKVEEWK